MWKKVLQKGKKEKQWKNRCLSKGKVKTGGLRWLARRSEMSERRKVAVGRGGWPAIVLANRIFQNRRRRRLFHWVAWHFCNGGILLLSFGSFVFPSPFTVLSSSPRSSFNWVTTARKLNRKRHSWMQLERFEVRNRTRKKETLKTPLENRFR